MMQEIIEQIEFLQGVMIAAAICIWMRAYYDLYIVRSSYNRIMITLKDFEDKT